VLPAYLADLQEAASTGRLAERKLIQLLERLVAVVTANKAKAVFEQLSLDASQLFADLGHAKLPKLRSFLEKRLPRVI